MYFISLIQKALSEADPQKALTRALGKVMALRNDPRHTDEFAMFSAFMAGSVRDLESSAANLHKSD